MILLFYTLNMYTLHTADKGGYSSGVSFARNAFTCVFDFYNAAVVPIAVAGQWRALTWRTTDTAGNRQGLTIAEMGELGGPGFGGCPLVSTTSNCVQFVLYTVN
jgi:hypothetical protein